MVTITREEDLFMNKAGLKSSGDPVARYEAAKIEIVNSKEVDVRLDPALSDAP
jgi:hypothetical protein